MSCGVSYGVVVCAGVASLVDACGAPRVGRAHRACVFWTRLYLVPDPVVSSQLSSVEIKPLLGCRPEPESVSVGEE